MEIKVTITLMLMSIVSVILNFHTKIPFASLTTTLKWAQGGLVIMAILSVFLRRCGMFKDNFTVFSNKETKLKSHLYCWLAGLIIGAFGGYNYSVIESFWEMPSLKFWLMTSHCVGSFFTVVAIYLSECNYCTRTVFSMIYTQNLPRISSSEYFLSFICGIVVSDYIITIGIIYLGFFLVMYYCVYIIAVNYPYYSAVAVALFCCSNLLVNIFRIYYLRPKIDEQRAEKIFRENFPFTV